MSGLPCTTLICQSDGNRPLPQLRVFRTMTASWEVRPESTRTTVASQMQRRTRFKRPRTLLSLYYRTVSGGFSSPPPLLSEQLKIGPAGLRVFAIGMRQLQAQGVGGAIPVACSQEVVAPGAGAERKFRIAFHV